MKQAVTESVVEEAALEWFDELGYAILLAERASFVMPLICFAVIAAFGFRTSNVHGHTY